MVLNPSLSSVLVSINGQFVTRSPVEATGPPSNATIWTITHNLGSTAVIVQVREVSSGDVTGQTITITDSNTVTITSVPVMTANAFKAVILG